MDENSQSDRYHAVLCRSCGLPVSVPEAVLSRARAAELADRASPRETRSSKLNLRCHACEREYIYSVSEVTEREGIPWSQRARAASSKLLRNHSRLARAASA
jgi:hypothetical protein